MSDIIPVEVITEKIFEIRGQKAMIDADPARLYGVPTKSLNQAVKRNSERFPEDFMFQLTPPERDEPVTVCDRLTKLKHSSIMPHAFTEASVAMLSSVLNSNTAIRINLQIVRAFIRLRRMLLDHEALRLAIEGLERRVGKNGRDIQLAIKAIQSILLLPNRISRSSRSVSLLRKRSDLKIARSRGAWVQNKTLQTRGFCLKVLK